MFVFVKYPVPQHVLMTIWVHRERWRGGWERGFVLLITQNVSKKKKRKKKERKNESSHSVLCLYKWRQLFWSHLGLFNSQMEDCLSWCLTVQTQVWTTEDEEGANISKRHIKRNPPAACDVFEQIVNFKKKKEKKKSYNFEQNWPRSSQVAGLHYLEVLMHSPCGPDSDKMSSHTKGTTFRTASLLYTLCHVPLQYLMRSIFSFLFHGQ